MGGQIYLVIFLLGGVVVASHTVAAFTREGAILTAARRGNSALHIDQIECFLQQG